MIERWNYERKALVIADRAFGSVNVAEKIAEWGGACVIGIAKTNLPWIWSITTHGLPADSWRTVSKPGTTYMLSTATNDEGTHGEENPPYHHVIVTGHLAPAGGVASYDLIPDTPRRPLANFANIDAFLRELTTTPAVPNFVNQFSHKV